MVCKTLTCGIIGGGRISEHHLKALRGISGVHVAGICDLSSALARFMAERYAVGAWYTDYQEMLEKLDVRVVHVLTPPATHGRIVRGCLERGCHVIVEKPAALSCDEFAELWGAALSNGVRLIENHNYRFNEPILRLAQAVRGDRIGSVQEVEVRLVLPIRSGGRYADESLPHPSHQLPAGIIHEFITHLVYLLLRFMPDDAIDQLESVRSRWRNVDGGKLFKYDDLDAQVVAKGVHGRIRFSCHQYPDCLSVQVRGTHGCGVAELFHPSLRLTTCRSAPRHLVPLINSIAEARAATASGIGDLWSKVRNRTPYEGLARFLQHTYRALQTGGQPPVTFEDMDSASRLIDALLSPENRV